MCPFSIYPLYTRTVILSLDKPIADCFLFRPRKSRERRRKRSHTNVSNASVTRTSRVCQTLLQTPLPCFHASINEYYTAKNGLGTIAPRLLSQVKVGTHSPSPTGSHTRAYTAKHGRFGWGWYHYPRSVSHVSETLRGQVSEQQTLPLLSLGRGRSRRTQRASEQRCAHACRCSEASRPRWAALLCLQFGDVAVFSLCAQGFPHMRKRGRYHYPRRALRAAETPDDRLSKELICRFLRSSSRH